MKDFLDKIGHDIFAFTSIFDSILDLIFVMVEDHHSFRYVYVNQSATKILNDQKSIVGRRIEEVVPKDQAKKMIPYYKQALTTQNSLTFINTFQAVDGDFIGETVLNPIKTEDGECKYILAIVRDITDRTRKERELEETKRNLEKNQKRLQSLVEHNVDAVFELDLQGNFISINKRVTELTGYKKTDIVGRSFIPLIVEEYLEETSFCFKQALNGSKEEYLTWIQKRNGQKALLYVKNVPIMVDGKIDGVYGIAKDITEQNKMGRLLKESEQRYKSLFENHPDAIFSYDLEGNFTSGNEGVERISGYSHDEFLGRSFISMMVPEDVEKTLYHFHKAIEDRKTESYEVAVKHKNGHRVELFVMNIPIIVDDQVTGIYGLAKDVTETKRIQQALIETKEELEIFWKDTIDPVYFVNANGEIKKVNPAFEKLFGYSEKEIVDTRYLIVPVELKDDIKSVVEKIRNGEVVPSHETKRVTKSGEVLDFLVSYTPVRNEKEKIIGATVFNKDITDWKRAEKELRKSEGKYRLITENAFDVIKLINSYGIIEYVSPSNEEILGYTSLECVGQPFTRYIHPDDIPKLEKGFKRLVKAMEASTAEIRILHKKGHWVWLEVTITPIIEDGKVTQLVTISRDITERKRHRDKLAKMAFYDYLSGLPNRRIFDDCLEMAIHEANRSKKKVAVMMLDGRNFKKINDTFGHDAGDAVIQEMAKRLQVCVRKTDTVARLGGDEMGIVLPEMDSTELAEDVAKRIIHSFEEPLIFNNNEIRLGAGIGIAFYPDHSVDKKQLVKYADEALYHAKESEQNEYRIYG